MKVLISAFEPFGGEAINPSSLILEQLSNHIGAFEIVKILLPVTFNESSEKLSQAIQAHQPDFVLSLGQAGGRSGISIEKIGINLNEAPIPDNAGQQPRNESIAPSHPDGYFSTLPIDQMLKSCKEAFVPCYLSYSAGTYVCNHVLFSSLAFINEHQLNCKAGFVHIPFLPEQVIDKPNQPSMSLDLMIHGIQCMIESFDNVGGVEFTGKGFTH
jgi:pyroglutamyl-peptidase